MYEKRDKSNLPQKITSRECVLPGPKMLKIDYSGGWGVRRSHVPGYMAQDFWTIEPLAHG